MKRKVIALLCLVWLTATGAQAQGAEKLYGFYVGDFIAEHMDENKHPMSRNKINISIDSIAGNKINGHSVVAGNKRPFSGTIAKQKDLYQIHVKEPGDDQYDGAFDFTLDPQSHTVKGTWTANDKKLAVTYRTYDLTRQVFKYDPNRAVEMDVFRTRHRIVYDTLNNRTSVAEVITLDAGKFNASVTPLHSRDVENMYKRDLEVMRNAIYARHGYSFQNREMRFFFDSVDWYIPVSVDVTNELTEVEKKNIEILKRYEHHAATYYDRFGR